MLGYKERHWTPGLFSYDSFTRHLITDVQCSFTTHLNWFLTSRTMYKFHWTQMKIYKYPKTVAANFHKTRMSYLSSWMIVWGILTGLHYHLCNSQAFFRLFSYVHLAMNFVFQEQRFFLWVFPVRSLFLSVFMFCGVNTLSQKKMQFLLTLKKNQKIVVPSRWSSFF